MAMLLRYSLQLEREAAFIESAVAKTIEQGARTADLVVAGAPALTTRQMGDAVLAALVAS